MEEAAEEEGESSDDHIDIQNLQFHEKLGRGGYGSVNRVTFKKSYKGYHEAAAKSVTDFHPAEVEIMTKMCHPHIVDLLGVYENGPIHVIVMEFACNGSLHDYLLDNQDVTISHGLIRKWAQESVLALQYLHQSKILHRDIKVQNCLLFQDDLLKLCDFGIAKELDYSLTTSSQKGTYRYMSPEILRGNKRGRSVYSRKSDIYAYGMLLLEISTKKPPFDSLEYGYIVYNVGRGALQPSPPTPAECPPEMITLIRQCWSYEPMDRPDTEDFIQVFEQKQVVTLHPIHKGEQIRAGRIAGCPNGDFLVASVKEVFILSPNGKSKRALAADSTTDLGYVDDITISSQGYVLVLVNNSTIKMFDLAGRYIQRLDKRGPFDTFTTDTENILMSSRKQSEVKIFACPHGNELQKVKSTTNIRDAGSIIVNNKSQILLHRTTTTDHHTQIIAINYSGERLFSCNPMIGTEEDPQHPAVFQGGITCDPDNNIYVALRTSSRSQGHIHKYDEVGVFLECIAHGLYDPCDLAVTCDGCSLVVANINSILIYRI